MRKDKALLFDTDSLYTLGLMAKQYKNFLNSPEEEQVIKAIRLTIKEELLLRTITENKMQKQLDLINTEYEVNK